MALIRIERPDELRPTQIVLLALLILALAGACLLTSAGKPAMLPDGAVEWAPNSLLLALVEILDLQYAQPTPNGVAIKELVHGVASGLGVLIAMIGLVAWARSEARGSTTDIVEHEAEDGTAAEAESLARRQLNPARTAQAMMLLYVLWSFASIAWSDAPQYARAGAVLLAIQAAWAFALGFGLGRRTAVYAAYALLGVLLAAATLAIVYEIMRNPTLRASYPVGNPISLATALLPGLAMGLAALIGGALDIPNRRAGRGAGKIILGLVALAVLGYATWLTRSRGPAVGGVIMLMVMVLARVGRRLRLVLGIGGAVLLVGLGAYLFSQRFAESATGRSDSMRLRLYAWPYALDMLQEHPLVGAGQAGFCLKGDVRAIHDVENDPAALEYRISHAHQEWLEIAADLGVVGLILAVGALALTLLAALRALPQMRSRAERLTAIALMGALAGIMAAECFGVALRLEVVPLVFYTIVGLLWAMAAPVPARTLTVLGRSKPLAALGVVAAAVACLGIVELSRRDFAAARAAYEAPRALQAGDVVEAEQFAVTAYADRLNPHRRLVAGQRLLVETRLQLARWFQDNYQRRLQMLAQAPDDPRLQAQAAEYRKLAATQIELGEALLADLVAVAPTVFYTGSLSAAFKQLRMVFASIDQNPQAMAEYQLAAAVAMRAELDRRPFNADVAAQYVALDYSRLDTPELLTLLARPMRRQRPDPLYLDVLAHAAEEAGGAQALLKIFDDLAAAPPAGAHAQWPSRWTPELLRLGAFVAYSQGDPSRAERYLSAALGYYDALAGSAPLAHAWTLSERADMLLLVAPENIAPAIASAEQALALAPDSEAGRALVDQVKVRLLLYRLAAGEEDAARAMLRTAAPAATDEELAAALADRYVQLAFAVFETALTHCPEKLDAWAQRALTLAPEDAGAWFLAGELALRAKDPARLAEAARAIVRYHGDPGDVLTLLQRALTVMPADETLQKMHDSLRAALLAQQGSAGEENSAAGAPQDAGTNGPAVDTNGLSAGTNGVESPPRDAAADTNGISNGAPPAE